MLDAKIKKISDLCGGKADTDFAGALREVIDNMADPKCDSKAMRRISIDVFFKQDPRNGTVDIVLETTTKLAKPGGRRSIAFIGKGHDGQLGLFTDDPDQVAMFNQLADGQRKGV